MVICGLAAVGVILTPIYLLSMLREIFFGKEKEELVSHTNLVDACLLYTSDAADE